MRGLSESGGNLTRKPGTGAAHVRPGPLSLSPSHAIRARRPEAAPTRKGTVT